MKKTLLLLSLCFVFLSTVCFAQETATLSGKVTDEELYTVGGANLHIISDDGEFSDTYETIWNGEYIFELPFGEYLLTITASGYHEEYRSLTVDSTDPIILDILMISSAEVVITPVMPANFRISRTDDNKIRLEWDAVLMGWNANAGEEVDLDNPDLVTYEVRYRTGAGAPTDEQAYGDTYFIIDELPELGVYTFGVKAVYEGEESQYTSSYTINTIDNAQFIVADANNMGAGYDDYPFVSQDWEAADVSGISQTVYSVEEMGGAMYIEELSFFITNAVNSQLNYKISLGYKDNDSFSSSSDFVPQNMLKEVFDGILNFNSSIITVPIDGFYYDGTKPLVMQLLKSFEGKGSIVPFVNAPAGNIWDPGYNNNPDRTIKSKSTTDDISEMTDVADYPNKAAHKGVAALVVNKDLQTIKLSGTIKEGGETPVSGATIKVNAIDGEGEIPYKPLYAEFTATSEGEYSFEALPFNNYQVIVSALGYRSEIRTLSVSEIEDAILDISMTREVFTPIAPENLMISRLEDGSVKFEWDAVTKGFNASWFEVDLDQPDLVTYEVVYHGGDISIYEPETVPVSSTSYTVEFSTMNVYEFTVKAIYKGRESSNAYPSAYILNTTDGNQAIVADVNSVSYSYEDYPFVSNDWNADNVSGISQTIYSVEAMGGEPVYIDKLYFFITEAADARLTYKISLGYKDNGSFEDESDFVSQDLLQEVFNGEVDFNSNVITIPVTKFYYDATNPLVVQWVKPLDGKADISVYVNTPDNENDHNKTLTLKSTTVDYSELSDLAGYAGNAFKGVAVMVINKSDDVSIGKEISSAVAMFPNPSADGKFFIDVPASSKVEVFNAAGVLLTSKTFESEGIHEINLSSQNKGVYFLRINSNNTVQTIKALYK